MIKILLNNPSTKKNVNLFVKKIIFLIAALCCLQASSLFAQPLNDNCSGATALTVGTNGACPFTAGDVTGATQSMPSCKGTADDDVWFSFNLASTSNVFINVNPSASFDPVVELFSGTCGGTLTQLACGNDFDAGQDEPVAAGSLAPGTYYVRVHHFNASKPATPTFEICVSVPPIPANDECVNAEEVPVRTFCQNSTEYNLGATDSGVDPLCGGQTATADDDVWFKFVAPATGKAIIRVQGSKDFRAVLEVFDGCSPTAAVLVCSAATGNSQIIKAELSALVASQTYYFRVFHYFGTDNMANSPHFQLCISDPPSPDNNECTGAVSLATTTRTTYLSNTLNGATGSAGHPAVCTGNADDDLWYSFTASSSKHMVSIVPSSGLNTVIQVLDGCSPSAAVVMCGDADTGLGDKDSLKITGLSSGSVYYVRVFSSATGVTSTTSFDINAFSIPNNDDCPEAVALGLNGPAVAGTVAGATMSMSTCASQTATSSEDDVWYSFTAQTATDSIVVNAGANGASFDAVVELYSGTCGALTSMGCINATGAGQKEALKPTTLTPGTVYYVRVYDASNTEVATPEFTIAVQGLISSTRKALVENSLNVYPIPSNYAVTVNFTAPASDNISLKLVSTDGRTVYTNTIANTSGEVNEKINVSNLTKGIYLLQITVDGEIVSKKIVVN